MTEKLAEYLEGHGQAVVRNDLSANKARGVTRHAVHFCRALIAGGSILFGGRSKLSLGCNGGLGLIYTLFIVGCARARSIPLTLHHHTYGYITKSTVWMTLICIFGGQRLVHVFLSSKMQSDFEKRYGEHLRAEIIQNAVFVPSNFRDAAPKGDVVRVGLISNLDRDKGLYDFLKVAKTVALTGRPAEMHLAGPVKSKVDQEVVAEAIAKGEIFWHGPLYGDDKNSFFSQLDLFLFPTRYRYEAQPTVIYEAFSAGVPVVSCDRGTIKDQVRECLAVVSRIDDFEPVAIGKIDEILSMSISERSTLRERARLQHASDAEAARRTLSRLFDLNEASEV